jgi:hypothetical protein
MLRDLLHKRVFIMDAITPRSMASGRHGNNIDALGKMNQVTGIHGKVFLSSAVQAIPNLLNRSQRSCRLMVHDGEAHAVPWCARFWDGMLTENAVSMLCRVKGAVIQAGHEKNVGDQLAKAHDVLVSFERPALVWCPHR